MIDREALRAVFHERYEGAPRLFRAPGRVNIIGEHTDYNDGFVLPMAIDRETVVAAAPRAGRRVRVYSLNTDEEFEFDLDAPGERRRGIWLDYVEGVARVLEARGVRLAGCDMALNSDVPVGAGLSSSAALEVSSGLALSALAGVEVERVDLALAGQKAEHEYVGTMCGIMDQFIAALGRAAHALLIDCRTLEARQIPFDTSDVKVVICDTNVKHELSGSEYNTRRAECEQGVALLKRFLPDIRALRDVTVVDFEAHESQLPDVVRRRCRHVVTENDRTLEAAHALSTGALDTLGELMGQSHRSLRDDYEVSCRELDVMAEIAWGFDGAFGARMTGGGFGGCTVNLVRAARVEEFTRHVGDEYSSATGRDATIYVSDAGDGAKEITE